MKIKSHLQLRKIGQQYIIVNVCSGNANLSDVCRLNETAAALWQQMAEGVQTAEELAAWLQEEYEVDRETALKDVERQLEEWKGFGLID